MVYAFGSVVDSILILVMAFYLSIQEKGIYTFLKIITPRKNEAYVLDLWGRVQQKIGLWFKGQLFLGVAELCMFKASRLGKVLLHSSQ